MQAVNKEINSLPLVSVIMPVRNEGRVLHTTIQSLTKQQTPDFHLELLIVDGCSEDDSQAIVECMAQTDSRIRLLVNPQRRTPFAFNLGLREARGEYVAVLGAHCEYQDDYLTVCLHELLTHDAAGCGGRVITKSAGEGKQARLAAWVLANPFAVSGNSFRTQPEGTVESVNYPVFRKHVLVELGGYNEILLRNQDNDMNYRIRRAGYTLYCTWKTQCIYDARPDLRELLRYADQNGLWCAVNAVIDFRSLSFHHYVPLLFVLNVFAGVALLMIGLLIAAPLAIALGLLLLCTIPVHLAIGIVFSLPTLQQTRSAAALLLPPLILIFHLSYGWGFLRGLIRPVHKITGA